MVSTFNSGMNTIRQTGCIASHTYSWLRHLVNAAVSFTLRPFYLSQYQLYLLYSSLFPSHIEITGHFSTPQSNILFGYRARLKLTEDMHWQSLIKYILWSLWRWGVNSCSSILMMLKSVCYILS